MAADVAAAAVVPEPSTPNSPSAVGWRLAASVEKHLTTYLGASFAVFLGLLPRNALSYISCLRARNRMLSLKLLQADEQLRQMRSRRQEDSKANARVAEIFASHRNASQQRERRLMAQIDAAAEEIGALRKKVEEVETAEAELLSTTDRLRLAVSERDEVIDFMSRKIENGCAYGDDFAVEVEIGAYGNDLGSDFNGDYEEGRGDLVECASAFSAAGRASEGWSPVPEVCYDSNGKFEQASSEYSERNQLGGDNLSASKAWKERSDDFASFGGILNRGSSAEPEYDLQFDSLASLYPAKHYYVARREAPWKVDCNSAGVSAKLKLLENELVNLGRLGSGELSRVPSLMRKQAKRYQSLAGKIDDLCRRMQVSDPSEPTLRPEFRAQRQTEYLLELSHLQHRASEIRQKLASLQSEAAKTAITDDPCLETMLNTRRSSDSIRISFEGIQRNLEIWLARIMGELEGILATSGVSHGRERSITERYPLVE